MWLTRTLWLCAARTAFPMPNGLARTPPMGWSSWNAFGGHQSPDITLSAARALVSLGLDKLGYKKVDIDGGWYDFNRPLGPGGPSTTWPMRNLTDAVHALGLEIGMYVTGGFAAVYGHEAAWARAVFTEWGYDGIKIDHMCSVPGCNVPGVHTSNIAPPFQGPTMARWAAAIAAENATSRALVQNCGVGCSPSMGPNSSTPTPWGDFCSATANMWRTSGDIAAMWGPLLSTNVASLIGRGSMAGPGGWNYPDSLEIGNGHKGVKLTPSQSRAHFSLWCVTSSPLYLGMNLSAISADDLAIVSNRDAIAVNQAWAGYAGDMLNFSQYPPANPAVVNVSAIPTTSVWWKPLPGNGAAVVLLNKGGALASVGFSFQELQWAGVPAVPSKGVCDIYSVWDGKSLGAARGAFEAQVAGESVLFLVLRGCAAAPTAPAASSLAGIGIYNDTLHSAALISQLPVAANLTGPGGWVLLFFESLDPTRPATNLLPQRFEVDLLNAAYEARVKPIVRLGINTRNYRNFSDDAARMNYTTLAALFRNYVAALPLPPSGTASGDALHIVLGNELNICVEWNSYMAPCCQPPIASGAQWTAEVAAFSRDVLRALRPLPGLLLGVGPLAPSGPGGCPCSGGEGGGGGARRLPYPLRPPPAPPLPAAGPAYPPAGCSGAGVPYPANFSGTAASFIQFMVACEPALFAGVDFFASHPYPGCNEAPSAPCALAGLTGYVAERAQALHSWRLNPAHAGVAPELPVLVTETAWWGGNESAKALFMVDALRNVWGADANVSGVTPFLLAGGHWDVDGFTWTRWNGNALTYLQPIFLEVQALARNGSVGALSPLAQR